jgi:hypothetical protein
MLVQGFRSKAAFLDQWPESVDALSYLHEHEMILPDYRYELAHDRLQRNKIDLSTFEIAEALRQLWNFGDRGYVEMGPKGIRRDFQWAAYTLIYLGAEPRVIRSLLNVFVPLLGGFAFREFGRLFCAQVCATFVDDVGHLIWDIQEAEFPSRGEFFDWHRHRNCLTDADIYAHLTMAELPALQHSSYPPWSVMERMMDSIHLSGIRARDYRAALRRFYGEHGYDL